ncbi:MAG: DUF4394 domain-containing protein [Chitinophagales bacterium]|nr:DUF4394 domain-containing protein [Chitinophagales bacterium]
MNPKTQIITCGQGLRGLLTLLIIAAAFSFSHAQLIYGLQGSKLISFDAGNPNVILSSASITGITSGQKIEGMDFRPLTGQLYALGYNKSNMQYQVYTLSLTTGTATAVNVPDTLNLGITFPPSKTQIGFDFNPTVDRIRVTSTRDFNYRLNPNNGAIAAVDGTLSYAAGDVNQGVNPFVASVAYTNSYAGATATTLYDLDTKYSILATQNPPNNGTLNTIGSTGIMFREDDPRHDIDIFFDPATLTNKAFISAYTGNSDRLYSVNLTTGTTTFVGKIGNTFGVSDIAVFIDRRLPEVTGNLIYALTSNNHLISFDSENPSIVRSQIAVTGVMMRQTVVGMDFRPATGELFALGYNATTTEAQLYIVNTTSGISAVVAAPVMLTLSSMVVMDFNPTVDRIRVMSTNDANYRLNPITGAIAATDANLNYDVADVNFGANPNVNAVAYTNSFSGSVTTTLFDYDFALNILAKQIPPNDGKLLTIGASGITVNVADPSIDMDIFSEMSSGMNVAYLAANTGAAVNDMFYTIDVNTGAATSSRMIGFGIAVRNIAVMQGGAAAKTAYHSISEENATTQLRAFPNPSFGSLTIELQGAENQQALIELFDLSGKSMGILLNEVMTGALSKQVDVSHLPKGVYVLKAWTGEEVSQHKIVVQ